MNATLHFVTQLQQRSVPRFWKKTPNNQSGSFSPFFRFMPTNTEIEKKIPEIIFQKSQEHIYFIYLGKKESLFAAKGAKFIIAD